MLGKRIASVKKLAKKIKVNSKVGRDQPSQLECLLRESDYYQEEGSSPTSKTPTGYFAVYVGVERQRFVMPTGCLSHPLFKMMLEKAYHEFGFEQSNGLVVPCSVAAFQEVASAVECCNRKFDFGDLVEEFL